MEKIRIPRGSHYFCANQVQSGAENITTKLQFHFTNEPENKRFSTAI